jgi:arabinose-5-phosphate isomerase
LLMAATTFETAATAHGIDAQRALALGRDVLATEAAAIRALETRLGAAFLAAAGALFACRGRVVVTGIGKSGHIARKLAATLASTGTPAFFVHAAEASHGDLGMITADDVVLLLSNSGETDELVSLIPHLKRQGAKLIALTGNEHSSLAHAVDVHLDASVDAEACPLGLAPTASTTAALALGDALALTLLDARGFSVEDFARAHPGGALGRRLLTRVRDVMRTGDSVPAVPVSATLADVVVEMSGKGMGMTAVVDSDAKVAGIFTDGDLRRCLGRVADFSAAKVAALMTATPRTIDPDRLAIDCVELMETPPKVSQLLVVDTERKLIGALHLHDLFRAKVV